MKREYDDVLSEYGIAAYDEGLSNTKTTMTEREKFAKEYSLHAGISVESIKFDDYGTPYIDTPYVTTVIPNAMVQAAYWGWKAAKTQAVPQWIPVSERLPTDGANVLIFDKFGTHGSIYTLKYYDGFMLNHKGVTHWMLLPGAPEQNK